MRYQNGVEGCYKVSCEHVQYAYDQIPHQNKPILLLEQALSKLEYIKNHPDKDINMEWSDEVNCRHGFYASMTGLVSEYKVIFNLHPICNNIKIITDRTTQSWLGIDLETDVGTIQSKTIKFEGAGVKVYKEILNNQAKYMSLTDIDDNETYIISTQYLKDFVDHRTFRYIYKYDLINYGLYFFKNNELII